ncbi:PepSY-associated TM helix domain-containing protein [Pseudonocardia xinjiangensis]|uniref:PepSY-associated TM helix domain-containing protein n=1 Tax=Pseudonocardia xinjiangensis TaxID=75289 RepID=UPI003D92D6D3
MSATIETGSPDQPAPRGSGPTPPPGIALRRLARRVHLLAGLAIAPFLAVLCLTGLAYAVAPSIDEVGYRDLWYVDTGGAAPRPVSEQVAAALATRPGAELASVQVPPTGRSTVVVLDEPGLADTEARAVYVDPSDNEVLGEITTVGGRSPMLAWLRELHGNLHLGDVGRLYAEFVAGWLPVVVLGGLLLWIGGRRRRTARALLAPRLAGSPESRLRSIHGALGLWLSVGLLALSVTGLTWSNYAGARVDDAIELLGARTPALAVPPVGVLPGVEPMSLDRALAVAEGAGLDRPLTVTPPAAADRQFRVAETADGLPIRRDAVAINPYTAELTDHLTWAEYPLLAKLTTLGIQAHSGTLLGLVNQIVLAAVAVGALVLLVVGCRMWWRNRPVRSAGPGPGDARLSPRAVLGVVLVTVLAAWAMPVLGVTLGAFLLLDLIVGRVRKRGTAAGPAR